MPIGSALLDVATAVQVDDLELEQVDTDVGASSEVAGNDQGDGLQHETKRFSALLCN